MFHLFFNQFSFGVDINVLHIVFVACCDEIHHFVVSHYKDLSIATQLSGSEIDYFVLDTIMISNYHSLTAKRKTLF